MPPTDDFLAAIDAIRSASALTETTFVGVGQRLEESIEILAKLAASFEAVLMALEGEDLRQALLALSGTAVRVRELGQDQTRESARFDTMVSLTESVGARIARMKVSLKDVESLAVNSKIAAANIHVVGMDFTTFANDIGRTLRATRKTLDQLEAELRVVGQRVGAARTGQLAFASWQQDAAQSITERLSATVQAITQRHHRAARASLEVRMGSTRVRQRICDAILALQIGDITRQRLEHADHALNLIAAVRAHRAGIGPPPATESPPLTDSEQWAFILAAYRIESAQLTDAARNFDRDVLQISESLNSLAAEARILHGLGDAAYGSAERGGGSFVGELEHQVAEALTLFERFETAREELASVTAMVSDATAGFRGHLRTVQALEADIRIMALNTTFRCARVGREGLALSVVAQELRGYANGFAKEAAVLLAEVENIAELSAALIHETAAGRVTVMREGTRAMRDSLATLRQMGQVLDAAMMELESDSDHVEALLLATVANLSAHNEIGQALRDAAGNLLALLPSRYLGLAKLPPAVEQMLELLERGYTMATERAVHDRLLGRATPAPLEGAAPEAELEDFLF